jgi:prevent-host-death family protein
MAEVNIHEAKTHLSRLLARVVAGEEIVISKAGKPMAKLVPYQRSDKPRVPGRDEGSDFYIADDFDAPLPDEILKYFT